jgi:hypothetical protein
MQMIALHKNGLDVFSAPCYFFEIILPALQGSAAASALRCSMERMIPSSVLLLSWSSSFFYSKVIGAVKADDAPPAVLARPHPFQIPGRDLGQKSYRNVSFANTQSNEQVQ